MKIVCSFFCLATTAVLLGACQPATSSSDGTRSVTLSQEDPDFSNHRERKPCCRRAGGSANR